MGGVVGLKEEHIEPPQGDHQHVPVSPSCPLLSHTCIPLWPTLISHLYPPLAQEGQPNPLQLLAAGLDDPDAGPRE